MEAWTTFESRQDSILEKDTSIKAREREKERERRTTRNGDAASVLCHQLRFDLVGGEALRELREPLRAPLRQFVRAEEPKSARVSPKLSL